MGLDCPIHGVESSRFDLDEKFSGSSLLNISRLNNKGSLFLVEGYYVLVRSDAYRRFRKFQARL